MLKSFYSIRDNVSNTYDVPFAQDNSVVAMRNFMVLASNPQYNINKFPAEFDLMHVGDFDQEKGVFKPIEPVKLLNGKDAVELYSKNQKGVKDAN